MSICGYLYMSVQFSNLHCDPTPALERHTALFCTKIIFSVQTQTKMATSRPVDGAVYIPAEKIRPGRLSQIIWPRCKAQV